jgi:hypothetical protein
VKYDSTRSRWLSILGLGVALAGPLAAVWIIRQGDQGWWLAVSVHWRVVLGAIGMSAFLGVLLTSRKLGQFLFVSAALALFGLAWLGKRKEYGLRTQPGDGVSLDSAHLTPRETSGFRLLRSAL